VVSSPDKPQTSVGGRRHKTNPLSSPSANVDVVTNIKTEAIGRRNKTAKLFFQTTIKDISQKMIKFVFII